MTVRILQGDCRDVLKTLPDESVHCVVTSPPYWGLRDYGVPGQLGLERDPAAYVMELTDIFGMVRRVLRSDGTLWLNMGDCYCASPNSGTGWDSSTLTKPNGRPRRAQLAQMASMRPGREFPGLKPKDLIGVPWMLAFALRADGWWLRQDLIWSKPNPMPESVQDRCTKAHEYLFLLAKSERYYFDAAAIAEPSASTEDWSTKRPVGWADEGSHAAIDWATTTQQGRGKVVRTAGKHSTMPKNSAGHRIVENVARARAEGADHDSPFGASRNKRSVWTVTTKAYDGAHFATFPPDLIEPCILAGCPEGGTVLDPFGGAGTTGLVADRHHRNAILIELNPEYIEMARKRIFNDAPLFAEVS